MQVHALETSLKVGEGVVGAAAIAGTLVLNPILRRWHHRWGASDIELHAVLPGDEIVKNPKYVVTHGITIYESISEIWPWLVQIGETKGGFYSYEFLENLCGCHMHNADDIIPKFQELNPGDAVWLHPKAPVLPVVQIEPYHFIVLGSPSDEPSTWVFVLKELTQRTSRLIVRLRSQQEPKFPGLGKQFFDAAHFVMERKMMLGIKHRAEREHAGAECILL